MLLEVAVAAPVRQTYTYSAGGDDPGEARVGDHIGRRVLIPFGRRPATGYVLGESGPAEGVEIKPVVKFIDESPLFPAEQVPFFRWVADYYHYPLGLVVKTALPGGLTAAPARLLTLTDYGSENIASVPERIRASRWFQTLSREGSIEGREAGLLFATAQSASDLRSLAEAGIVALGSARDRIRAREELCYRLDDRLLKMMAETDPEGLVEECCRVAGRQLTPAELKSIMLLARMQRECSGEDVPRREIAGRYRHGERLLKALAEGGLVKRRLKRTFRSPFGDLLTHHPPPERLSAEQQTVLTEIGEALGERRCQPFLLHGITGSGKTEVYLEATARALDLGLSILVLVPEIALATQIEAYFVSRFRDEVALLHSGLSPGERFDEWWRILSGEARVVIGARSAIFAPLRDIGLIIVDEEHDASYKQEDGLRYNGRDLALVRAEQAGCVALLGSATPAVTSYYHSTTNKYRLLRMDRRIGDRELPLPLLVDMKERSSEKGGRLFHPDLQKALRQTFERGQQSILLLNRRGFSTSVICRSCGTVVECDHCRVTMNRHRQRDMLLCHYCGFQRTGKMICAICGSANLYPVGFGTERVEEEAGKLLPGARITRLDSDVAGDRKRFLTILQAMRNEEIDVLVGTQIIAKGLHFPGVSLVGIVMADSGLGFPDYRAAEKTFQLITQVTGRAGRGQSRGTVVIQTMQPDHYAIAMAAENRYQDLVTKELNIRREVGFPPFSRLVFIIVEHPKEATARRSSEEISALAAHWCRRHDPDRVLTILGPAPAPLERLRDRYRWQILLKSARLQSLHGVVEWISRAYRARGETRLIIDIDPENML